MKRNCHNCVYREVDLDGVTTIIDKYGKCRCTLENRTSGTNESVCIMHRTDDEGPHDAYDILDLVRKNPIEFTEDTIIKRKLSGIEKLIVNKNIEKFYKIPK